MFFFDGKVKTCKGLVSLTASVYHPLIRRLVPLATMERQNYSILLGLQNEDCCPFGLFGNHLNGVLREECRNEKYFFHLGGWVPDMAGSNIEGLRRSVGPHALERVKTYECYFPRLSEPAGSKEEERRCFKELCNRQRRLREFE